MKLRNTDNGNCRVYYKNGRDLYCFQEDRPHDFRLYACSRDGEPSHEVSRDMRMIEGLPTDDSVTARNFRDWIRN